MSVCIVKPIYHLCRHGLFRLFFFNDPATTEIYTLSLHDALPICVSLSHPRGSQTLVAFGDVVQCTVPLIANAGLLLNAERDRKSTRLNSSHITISYAVFCLKKKKKKKQQTFNTNV